MSTPTPLSPVPYNTPLLSPQGVLSSPWQAWFRDLLTRVGGNQALTNLQLGQMVSFPISIGNGGTGQISQQAAINALTGSQVVGKYLRSDGTNATLAGIQAADVPTLNQSTTGTAANITGTAALANGGTGQTTAQAAMNALAGTQVSGKYLRSDGTNTALATIVAGDVPTLNQNTTGTAASVTGTNVVANSNLSQMAANTIKGNNTGSTANAADLTTTQVKALLHTAPTIQKFTSGSGTYTLPAGVLHIRVRMVGGGAGGWGGGAGGAAPTTAPTASTFGTSLLSAGAGSSGGSQSVGSNGGTSSLGSGPIGIAPAGGMGGAGGAFVNATGGMGGASIFGGGGTGGISGAGGNAATVYGAGGGGGGGTSGNGSAGGGGAGGGVDAIIASPAATYSYVVGAAGNGGAGPNAGGAGMSGIIVVEEYYS